MLDGATSDRSDSEGTGADSFVPECIILDDDAADDLDDVRVEVEGFGLSVRLARGLGELGHILQEYLERRVKPSLLLLDVHIPDYTNFGLLGKPNVKIPDVNKTGIVLYEKVILEYEYFRDIPTIFISNHNKIALYEAHRLRVKSNKEGRRCYFAQKATFASDARPIMNRLFRGGQQSDKEAFGNDEFEKLWAGICDFYGLIGKERFAALGMTSDAGIDVMSFISSSIDARARIDMMVDIGVCLNAIYSEDNMKSAMQNLVDEQGRTLTDVLLSGSYESLFQCLLELQRTCGVK